MFTIISVIWWTEYDPTGVTKTQTPPKLKKKTFKPVLVSRNVYRQHWARQELYIYLLRLIYRCRVDQTVKNLKPPKTQAPKSLTWKTQTPKTFKKGFNEEHEI